MLVKSADTEFFPGSPPAAYQPPVTTCPGATPGGGGGGGGGGGNDPNPGDNGGGGGGGGSDPPTCRTITICTRWASNASSQAGLSGDDRVCVEFGTQEYCG